MNQKSLKNALTAFSLLTTLSLHFFLVSCEPKPSQLSPSAPSSLKPNDASTAEATLKAALSTRGRSIYQTQCTACHNSDPRRAGSIGPALQGSSRELLEARILRAEYPAGYQPKRETHQMPAMPYLKNEVDPLAAYLSGQ